MQPVFRTLLPVLPLTCGMYKIYYAVALLHYLLSCHLLYYVSYLFHCTIKQIT